MGNVDFAGLVANGLLDVAAMYPEEMWVREERVATYLSCRNGDSDGVPLFGEVYLETAEAYGLRAYRWAEDEYGEQSEDVFFSEDEAVAAAKKYAAEHHEPPAIDEQIAELLKTGFFGTDASAADVRGLVGTMTRHHEGVLLLHRGAPVSDATWEPRSVFAHDIISVPADCDSVEIAAARLLAAISAHDSEV